MHISKESNPLQPQAFPADAKFSLITSPLKTISHMLKSRNNSFFMRITLGACFPQNPEGNLTTPLETWPEYSLTIGNKQYELSNYLVNVQATLSDRKLGREQNESRLFIAYQADVLRAMEYCPVRIKFKSFLSKTQKG
jgi:hypothetical protein